MLAVAVAQQLQPLYYTLLDLVQESPPPPHPTFLNDLEYYPHTTQQPPTPSQHMSTPSTTVVPPNNNGNRPPSKDWGFGGIMPKRSTSQSSLRPSQLNKLHLAIARKDLTKLRARLAQPKKAKAELVEFDHMEQTPLTAALRLNLVDFVRDLLEFYKQSKYAFPSPVLFFLCSFFFFCFVFVNLCP